MKQTSKTTKKRHSLLSAILVTLVLLIGLSLLLYPTVADYVNSLDYKKNIEHYEQTVQQLDDSTRRAMLSAARAYNKDLLKRSTQIGELSETLRARYTRLLDPLGTGMMGYIEIKKISLYLPVYHGAEESVLQAGVGHISGSSLPVGGRGAHAILSGHTGVPSSKLFSNIDQLQIGDTFTLHMLGEVLTYQVESTVVVLPEEAEKQSIDPSRDLCTLMTCTPYGVNTHRLLVRGVRIKTPPDEQAAARGASPVIPAPMPPALWTVLIGLPVLVAVVLLVAIRRKKRRKDDRNETER